MTDTDQPIEYMLTTIDNPFDPFNQFDEWYSWDRRAGYDTPSLLDRIANVSDEMSEPDQAFAIQSAIDEVVRENVSGMYKKIAKASSSA